jgi:hypothetical protein
MSPMSDSLDRRELLLALLGAAAVPAGLLTASCATGPDLRPLAAALRGRLRRPEAAVILGRRLAAENPREDEKRALAARLTADLEWSPELAGAELDRRLAEAIRADFRDGRTLSVGGWVLSATEGRVAALVALTG